MDGYRHLLHAVGDAPHQSCLLLTSRETPGELATLGNAVRTFDLRGLGVDEAQVLLASKELHGSDQGWAELTSRFGGNGLALKVVGESIRQLFGGDVGWFLEADITGAGTVFGDVRRLLAEQVDRSSAIEQQALRVLAAEREPVSVRALLDSIGIRLGGSAVLAAIAALRRRSLVELAETVGPAAFTLQSAVLEFATDRLVAEVSEEITAGQPVVLVQQPLIRAQAKDYVRQAQERLIGEPILRRLSAQRSRTSAELQLRALLDVLRGWPLSEQGFAPGNLVNLLRLLCGALREIDLSHLSIRQAYLQDTEARDANLAGAQLAETVLSDSFGAVGAVAISGDGERIAAGTLGGAVRVWRMADRATVLSVQPNVGGIWSVALSSDGRVCASGSLDATVELWDVDSGTRFPFEPRQTSPVTRIALVWDSRTLVTAALDGIVRIWDVETGQLVQTAEGHRGPVYGLAATIDGESVATGGVDGTVRLWDLRTGRVRLELPGHDGTVWSVSVDQSAGLIASGGQDGTTRVWDVSTGVSTRTLEGHVGAVRGVALSADGGLLATGGFDGTLRLWEPRTGRGIATVLSHSGGVRGVAVRRDGQTVVSGGFDASVRVWHAQGALPLATMQGHTSGVRAIAISGQGRSIASGGPDERVQLWDAETGQSRMTLEQESSSVRAVALSRDATLLAAGGLDATVRLWNAQAGRLLCRLSGHTAAVLTLAMDRSGDLLASGSLDGTVRLWTVDTGRPLAVIDGHGGAVWSVAVSIDGSIAASGGLDGYVRLWSTRTRELLRQLQGHVGGVRSVSLSADAQTIATGGDDGTVRMWDATRAMCTAVLKGHTAAVYGVSISPMVRPWRPEVWIARFGSGVRKAGDFWVCSRHTPTPSTRSRSVATTSYWQAAVWTRPYDCGRYGTTSWFARCTPIEATNEWTSPGFLASPTRSARLWSVWAPSYAATPVDEHRRAA
jgi:WD40 repeat protein